MSPRERGETGKWDQPGAFAAFLARAYVEMASAGEMAPNMKPSVTSLIYKEKGPRYNLKNYRPIGVCSVRHVGPPARLTASFRWCISMGRPLRLPHERPS